MKPFYKNLKEKVLLAIGAVLYFVLILINEILFELEYLFKRSKNPQIYFKNSENELIRQRLEKDSMSKFNTLSKSYIPAEISSQKIIAFPKAKNVELHEPISNQHHDLQWLSNNKNSF